MQLSVEGLLVAYFVRHYICPNGFRCQLLRVRYEGPDVYTDRTNTPSTDGTTPGGGAPCATSSAELLGLDSGDLGQTCGHGDTCGHLCADGGVGGEQALLRLNAFRCPSSVSFSNALDRLLKMPKVELMAVSRRAAMAS